jgi:mRNA interferase HigB
LFPFWERVKTIPVRVIARKTLMQFVDSLRGQKNQAPVRAALNAWFNEAKCAKWDNPTAVRSSYVTASFVGGDRVVFNIKGNDYRLVTAINYRRQIVYIKWLGSHRDYDEIDARTIENGD